LPGCVDGSLSGFAEEQLELGEDLLDRVQIGRIGRQEEELRADRPDGRANGCALVASQIVHDDDVAGLERRHEELLDPGGEALAVDWSIEDARRIDPIMPQSGQEGERTPFTERCSGDQLLPTRRPAPDRRHVRLRPGLIDEDEAARVKPTLILLPLCPPSRDLRPQLLDGEQRFF